MVAGAFLFGMHRWQPVTGILCGTYTFSRFVAAEIGSLFCCHGKTIPIASHFIYAQLWQHNLKNCCPLLLLKIYFLGAMIRRVLRNPKIWKRRRIY